MPKLDPEREERLQYVLTIPQYQTDHGQRYRQGQLARSVRRLSWQLCDDPEYRRWAAEMEADREHSLEELASTLNSDVESDDWENDCD